MCVDAMGVLMTTYHWPLEAGTIIGEQKANVKDRVRAAVGQFRDGLFISTSALG